MALIDFERDVKAKAKLNGVTIYKGQGQFVNCPGDVPLRVQGYFCDETLKLAVASNNENFISTYVHESCHMDQYLDGSEYWSSDVDNAYILWDKALGPDSHEVSDSELEESLNIIVMLEADCEIRTLQKIADYGLDVDPELYAQQANSYLYFHTAMNKYRRWYPISKTPSKLNIVDQFATTLREPEYYQIGNHDVTPETFSECFE